MSQVFRTHTRTNAYSITILFGFMCFFYLLSTLFFQGIVMPVFPVIAMQRFNFKNSIIEMKLFLVMSLNLYLTSERSQS